MPAYEVATIKPQDRNGYMMPLRVYIQSAFGIPLNTTGRVIGPDWINTTGYVIQGKPPDSIRDAMQTMTPQQRSKEDQLMRQSLLADRFHMKAHFETREMPMYQLVLAKGGSRLTQSPPDATRRLSVAGAFVKGTATNLPNLVGALESENEIGGRTIVDDTGLTGAYDFSLKWSPMQAPTSATDPAAPPAIEGPSLFTAIEEQLGLKLVPVKGPQQVLIIDHIERPSEN
jgi:uncharacterized protein (TIGR03435 family)